MTRLCGAFSALNVLGNFIADMMLSAVHADATLLNGGTLRSDRIHKKGDFRMKDLIEILPFGGNVCMLDVTGESEAVIC